jgi:SAM-dependent methyltransferase
MKYRYPDTDDAMLAEAVADESAGHASYFVASEARVIEMMKTFVGDLVDPSTACLLDAGGGVGGYIPHFAPLCSRIVFVEPDEDRLSKARTRAREVGAEAKVQFVCAPIEGFETPSMFDVILCNHVIQHVPTDAVPRILRRLRSVMRAEPSALLLTTTHTPSRVPLFVVTHTEGAEIVTDLVDRDAFDALARENRPGFLPTRKLAQEEVDALLDAAGFECRFRYTYHAYLPGNDYLAGAESIDGVINSDPRLQREMGEDLFVIAKPR